MKEEQCIIMIFMHIIQNVQIGDRRGIAMPMINDGCLSPIGSQGNLNFSVRLTELTTGF